MSPDILNFILWLPFLLVFFGIVISFCLKGFRKGIFHALISTGATVLAACVSFFVAKLLAPLAVDAVISALPDFAAEADSVISGILPMLIEGIVTGLLALIAFSVLFAILTPVCKFLLALVPTPRAKGLLTRLLGLALRFVDALAVSILVLLPIYGSLAAYAPAVDALMELTETDPAVSEPSKSLTVQDFIHMAAEHPVVSLTKCPPFSIVYYELSSVNTSAGVINVPEIAQTMAQTAETFRAIMDGDFTAKDMDAFIAAQKDVVDTEWFYTVCSAAVDSLEESMPEDMNEDAIFLQALLDLASLPREEFTQSYSGLLDWMSFAAEKGLFQKIEDETLTEEWLEQSGIMEKASEIAETLPEDSPFIDIIDCFFAERNTENSKTTA